MVVQDRSGLNSSSKNDGDDLIQRARVADSIHNALAPFGIGKSGWKCTAYDESGRLQEFHSGQFVDRRGSDVKDQPSKLTTSFCDTECSTTIDSPHPLDCPTEEDCTSLQATSARNKRIARQRGRSRLPRHASRLSAAPYLLPAQVSRVHSPVVEEQDPLPKKKQTNYFMIKEDEKVAAFIWSRLKRMQQLANKKIAKAWIKGICPKKQAKFPYQNKKQEGKDISAHGKEKQPLPAWWPDIEEICPFVEPDHIKRDERMGLCLHLLRLRPTPSQLREWNQDKSEPHPTHVKQGWTAFLEELAGPEIFEDLPKEDKRKTELRQRLLSQMYEVARMEEELKAEAIDGDTVFQWEEEEEDRKPAPPPKRTRQPSFVSNPATNSRASSVSASCTRTKKARRVSVSEASTIVPSKADVDMLDFSSTEADQSLEHVSAACDLVASQLGHESIQGSDRNNADVPQPRHSDASFCTYESVPMKRDSSVSSHAGEQTIQWNVVPGSWADHTASSFDSMQSAQCDTGFHSAFPGRQDYSFPHFQQQNMVQVQQVHHIQEPQFQTVPNTPMFSQAHMGQMPLTSYMPTPCELPPAPAYSTPMPPSQYFMPAGPDSAVAEFHPPMTMPPRPYQQGHHGLAERHIAPMQYHGLPAQGDWSQQYYHHHHHHHRA